MRSLSNIWNYVNINLKKAFERGFSYIFLSSILNKIFVLFSNIMLARLLPQEEYGYFSYAYNIISVVIIFSSLGMDLALLQFCCEDRKEEEKRGLEKYVMIAGMITNIVCAIILLVISYLATLSVPAARPVLMSLSLILPLPFLLNYCTVLLRVRFENKKYSLLTNIFSLSYLIFLLICVIPFGLKGAVVSRYLGYVIPVIAGFLYLKKIMPDIWHSKFPRRSLIRSLMLYGGTITVTNAVSQLLYYIDIYIVGLVTADGITIACYKTATIIPNALAALPVVVVTFIYPYFARNKDNYQWIARNTKRIQMMLLPICVIIAVIMYLFAPQIITVLFGKKYIASLIPFRILLGSFVVSAPFRVITGNIIAMVGKVRVNLYIGLISCSLNVILDFFLIKIWGSAGAAVATTLIVVLSAILSNIYLYFIFKNKRKKI